MTTQLSDKPTGLSTSTSPQSLLRRARAEAVLQTLPHPASRSILDLREIAGETELTVLQVETALEDLACDGLIELCAIHGRVRVRRLDVESEVSR